MQPVLHRLRRLVLITGLAAVAPGLLGIASAQEDAYPHEVRRPPRVINDRIANPPGGDRAVPPCPPNRPHCVWVCTGQNPLDGLDGECSDRWACYGCGENGGTVYAD